MIFKTFDNDIDKWTAKIGIFGKSFNELGNAVRDAFKTTIDNIDNFDEDISFWDALKNNLMPKNENGESWLKNSLGEIISKENIDSYIAELDLDSAKNKILDIFDWEDAIKNGDKTWQDYFDTLKNGEEKYIPDLIKNTDDLSKLTGEDLVNANQAARDAAIAHNTALEQQTLSAKAGQVALKGLAMAGNMFASWAVIATIEAVIKLADELTESLEEQKEKLEKTQSEISDYEGQISDLENKISENEKKIDEINSNPLDIVGKNTLSTLKDENTELHQQLELVKSLNNTAKELAEDTTVQILENTAKITGLTQSIKALESGDILGAFKATDNGLGGFINAFNKFSDGDILGGLGKVWEGASTSSGNVPLMLYNWFSPHKENEQSPTEEASAQIEEIKKLYDDLRNATDLEDRSDIQGDITEKTTTLLTNIKALQAYKSTLDKTDKTQAEWIQKIQEVEDAYLSMQTKKEDYNTFDEIINDETYSKDKDKLIELAKQGKLTADVIEDNYHNIFVLFEAIGLSVDDVIERLKKMGDEQESESQSQGQIVKTFDEVWSTLKSTEKNALKKDVLEGVFDKESIAEFQDLADNFSLEQIRSEILNLLSLDDKLQQFIDDSSNLTTAFTEMKKNGVVSTKTLLEMPEGIRRLDGYTDFRNTVVSEDTSKDKKKGAFEDLITEYLRVNKTIISATDKTRDYVINALKDAGIVNAEELVDNVISNTVNKCEKATDEISKLNESDLKNFIKMVNSKGKMNQNVLNEIGSNTALLFSKLGGKYKEDLKNYANALDEKLRQDAEYQKAKAQLEGLNSSLSNKTTKKTTAEQAKNNLLKNTPFANNPYIKSVTPDDLAIGLEKAKAEKKVAETREKRNQAAKKVKELEKQIDDIAKNAKIGKIKYNPSTSGSNGKKNRSDKTKTNTKQVIDWIERKLNRLNTKLDLVKAKYDNLPSSSKSSVALLEAENKNLDNQIKLLKKVQSVNDKSYSKYMKKADNSATYTIGKGKKKKTYKLSKSLKKKIRNGRIKGSYKKLIATYGEPKANAIQKYQDYYDKAQSAKKNSEDAKKSITDTKIEKLTRAQNYYDTLNAMNQAYESTAKGLYKNNYVQEQIEATKQSYNYQIKIAKAQGDYNKAKQLEQEKEKAILDLQRQKIENLKTEYDNRIGLIGNDEQNVNNTLSQMEARGQIIQSSYYSSLNNYENQKLSKLNSELKDLQGKQNTFTKYSQEWYDLQSDIQSVKNAINDAKVAIIENNKKVGELRQAMYDEIAKRNSNVSTEANFLAGLLGDNLTDDKTGGLTKEGLAMLGTYGIDMEANSNTAQTRKAEREELEKLISSYKKGDSHALDAYGSLEAAEKTLSEIIKKQQDAISAEYANEKQIYDLMTQRYEAQLSYMQSIIDAKKKALEMEKDLYEYQKNIANQTKNIATLEKQLASLQGDTSEEGRAKIQKIQVSLDEANQELQDTEYDRYISDQQNMLDNMYSQYEDLLQELEKDFEEVVRDGVDTINKTSKEISTTLSTYSSKYGYNPSKDMKSILNGLNVTTLPNSLSDGLSDLGVIFQKSAQDIIAAYTGNTKPTTESKPKTNTSVAKENGVNNSKTSSDYGYGATPQSYISNTGNSVVNASTYDKVASGVSDQGKKNAKVYDALNDLAFGFGTSKYWSNNEKNKTPSSKVNQWIQKQKTYSKSYNSKGDVVYRYLNETGLKALAKKLGVKYGEDSKYKTKEIAAYFKSAGIPGFQTGGVVRSNAPKTGDNVWVRVNPDETILTKKFTDILPYSLNVMNDFTKSVTLPNYSDIKPVNPNVGNTFGDIVINAELPNVKDSYDFVNDIQNNRKTQRAIEVSIKDCMSRGKITNNIQSIR